ncbi:hypothetical protein [Myroides odoratus]|uniref:hypothetical protein n=1 Tax=Myroides odoratus TaxID=256 RepID=UPI0039AF35B9
MFKRSKAIALSLACLGFLGSCENLWDRSSDCKVSTDISQKFLTFPNKGGEEYVDVNPKPYYIIQKVQIGQVGEEGYMYEERATDGYSTANYAVQKVEDGRLVIRTNPYYGDKPLKFEIEVKGGDCSATIYGTIQP